MTKITSTNQLPDWFNLESYSNLSQYTSYDWYNALRNRSAFCEFFSSGVTVSDLEELDFIEAVWEHNLCPLPEDFEHDLPPRRRPTTVTDLSLDEAYLVYHFMRSNPHMAAFIKAKDKWYDKNTTNADISEKEMRYVTSGYMFSFNSVWPQKPNQSSISAVDLRATDQQILQDMEMYLFLSRKDRGIGKIKDTLFSEANIKKWSHNKVLPYIDLCIWAGINNHTINQAVMDGALFPNSFTQDKARTTVASSAKKIFSQASLKALHSHCVATSTMRTFSALVHQKNSAVEWHAELTRKYKAVKIEDDFFPYENN
jgi:hypothetical protein